MTSSASRRSRDVETQLACALARYASAGDAASEPARAALEKSGVALAIVSLPARVPVFMTTAWRMLFGEALGSLPENVSSPRVEVQTHPLHDGAAVLVATEVADDSVAEHELVRAARADAEQANRLKDQFLAVVSHELRAPLTTMLLWEKILRDATSTDELRVKALDAIRASVVTQARIVGDLLDVSRAVSGKLHVDLRPVDLAPLIEAEVATAASLAAAKHVTLRLKLDSALGEVQGDSQRLHQIVENLLSNAVKFTDEGGDIAVTVARTNRVVSIEIADTGRGISRELLTRIFEPFTQFDEHLTRSAGGLGLGLAIAKQLVELHHGELTATSPGVGCGATFTVTLPSARARRAQSPPAAVGVTRLQGCSILVVDDDARVCEALQALLSRTGASVETALDAAAGRDRIAVREPDVLICDIAMPGEDGFSFIASLRARGVRCIAIALTAHATQFTAKRALECGFDRHVAKPIDIERLIGVLHELRSSRG